MRGSITRVNLDPTTHGTPRFICHPRAQVRPVENNAEETVF